MFEQNFSEWFLQKGIWALFISLAGLFGVGIISYVLYKLADIFGLTTKNIKDSRTSKLINLAKNMIIISLSLFIAGIPSFFGVLTVLNIESGTEGLGWALGSTYKLLFSKALPIFLVMTIGYLGLRVAANIVPELVIIYFSRSNQEEVEVIDPRLVGHDSEGIIQNVEYDRFVPHLINLVKRQSAEIETLKTKVAALESS